MQHTMTGPRSCAGRFGGLAEIELGFSIGTGSDRSIRDQSPSYRCDSRSGICAARSSPGAALLNHLHHEVNR